jgi:uncharacterized protein (UPF0147 family)
MQMNRTELLQHRINRESRRAAIEERAEAKRFLENPATPTAFSILDAIAADPNVSPAFGRCIVGRPTLAEKLAAKREEYDADARGADLYFARGGSGE